MTPREWFEGVLGYRLKVDEKHKVDYWERPDGMMVNSAFDGTFLGNGQERMIQEFQSEWIEHVVKPMRGMGYQYCIVEDEAVFEWYNTKTQRGSQAYLKDDNIFQASLDAAEKCPEVKEKISTFRSRST